MDDSGSPASRFPTAVDREILALALPAFATLVSEPVLLLADSAIVGHLGTTPLAGLAIATNVIGVLAGLSVFLAYGTTGTVARRLGAGDERSALAAGLDGMVLALIVGVALAVALQLLLPVVVGWYDAGPDVTAAATAYLRIAAWGLPSVLLLLASTGVLRGLQDTRTPLYVAVATNLANVGLNLSLVYGLDLGIAGSALGTLLAQTCAAVVLARVVVRGARRRHASLRFRPGGVLAAARLGGWLVLRTASLQVGITVATLTAARLGGIALATHQVTTSIWALLVFALDAVAIAAQAIVGRYLGAGDVEAVRRITRRVVGWGLGTGLAFGVLVAATRPLYDGLFSADPAVQQLLGRVLLVVAIGTPVAGIVFVLDGVLIGAGDARYLAVAGVLALLVYLSLVWLVNRFGNGLEWLWAAWAGYLLARMITLLGRARGSSWLRTGR